MRYMRCDLCGQLKITEEIDTDAKTNHKAKGDYCYDKKDCKRSRRKARVRETVSMQKRSALRGSQGAPLWLK